MSVPKRYSQTWDLDAIFPGGSESPEFARHLETLEVDIGRLPGFIEGLPVPATRPSTAADDASSESAASHGPAEGSDDHLAPWHAALERLQDVAARLHEASAFTGCLTAQNVKDEKARLLAGRIAQMWASLDAVFIQASRRMLELPDAVWQALLQDDRFRAVAFALDEMRRRMAERLPPEQETLVSDLAVDGYHGWEELYEILVGRITIPVEEDGRTVHLSVGQAANRMETPDRVARSAIFARWEQAWAGHADLFAAVLNHLAGFRLNLYRRRGWQSILKEPLDVNRMSAATLDAMWDAVEARKGRLLPYLERKARLLGVDALSWHDIAAPLPLRHDGRHRKIAYDEAADFVVEQFGRFSPDMAEFARQAFDNRWIEAEDRPGKQPGGFCTTFPVSRQSRIFMTFGGTADGVRTLAHELGHAFHQHVMRDLPLLVQRYPMSLAETASTFAELIVDDAALHHATDPGEKLLLLEKKLQRLVTFCMNIHARFLFETAMYEARKQGPLSVAQLNELMLNAQKQAYRGAPGEYHPHFWASKLHFYITRVPFYNFPYTFGFLFSTGVYARAKDEGPRFAGRYVELLRDTGRMSVEELARRHLGVDLARPDFWQEALDVALADVDEFLRLTE